MMSILERPPVKSVQFRFSNHFRTWYGVARVWALQRDVRYPTSPAWPTPNLRPRNTDDFGRKKAVTRRSEIAVTRASRDRLAPVRARRGLRYRRGEDGQIPGWFASGWRIGPGMSLISREGDGP